MKGVSLLQAQAFIQLDEAEFHDRIFLATSVFTKRSELEDKNKQ